MGTAPDTHPATLMDGVRFAFGTLTILPVRVTRWDRPAARIGMGYAMSAGLVVGLAAAAVGVALFLLGAGALLTAVASVAVPAVLTRGLHLDGLADVADGLGSGKPAAEALRIMKRSDIGPFGVLTLVLALLAQVAALAQLYADGWPAGVAATVVTGCVARTSVTLAAREGVASARPHGLGAAVAGTVPTRVAGTAAALTLLLATGCGLAVGGPASAVGYVTATVLALAGGELTLRRCRRRFGGVTGDVFGAVAECAATVAPVTLTLG